MVTSSDSTQHPDAEDVIQSAPVDPAAVSLDQLPQPNIDTPIPAASGLDTSLISGSLWKGIWQMSWPLLLTTLAVTMIGMVDVQVAGLIDASAQAAVGLAEHVIFMFMVLLMSLGVGTTAIVARAYGKQDMAQANLATAQSISFSLITGVILTIVALLTARYLIPHFSQSPVVVSHGGLYLSVYSMYLLPFSLICIVNAAFRAIGNAKIPMVIVATEAAINIAGDYLTVVYQWPVPGLGVKGIAYSAFAGAIVGALMCVVFLWYSPLKSSLNQLTPVIWSQIKRVLDVGVPSAFQRLSWTASIFGLFFILKQLPEPTAALAAWTVGIRIEGMLFMPMMALSLAVSSVVGQNLGANQVERAIKAGWQVTALGVLIILFCSVALFIYARDLASLFSKDAMTIQYSTTYLQVNAIAEPWLVANTILSGALQGAGDTKVTMWIALVCHWGVRLPLAWFLALTCGWGPEGAWWAMSVSVIISTLAIIVRFQSGRWAYRQV